MGLQVSNHKVHCVFDIHNLNLIWSVIRVIMFFFFFFFFFLSGAIFQKGLDPDLVQTSNFKLFLKIELSLRYFYQSINRVLTSSYINFYIEILFYEKSKLHLIRFVPSCFVRAGFSSR